MTDETREKLKAIRKKKPLQTAILTTLEYDSGFAQGEKAGYNQALDDVGNRMFKAMEDNPEINVESWLYKIIEDLRNGSRG